MITIFHSHNCSHCKRLIASLDRLGLRKMFVIRDVHADKIAFADATKAGVKGLPSLVNEKGQIVRIGIPSDEELKQLAKQSTAGGSVMFRPFV